MVARRSSAFEGSVESSEHSSLRVFELLIAEGTAVAQLRKLRQLVASGAALASPRPYEPEDEDDDPRDDREQEHELHDAGPFDSGTMVAVYAASWVSITAARTESSGTAV